jgi:hypothetical protein
VPVAPAASKAHDPIVFLNHQNNKIKLNPQIKQPQKVPVNLSLLIGNQAPKTKVQQTLHRLPVNPQAQVDYGTGK